MQIRKQNIDCPYVQELLERKADYCDHLLSVATKLCPGPSEMRGYLLWERHGVRLRLAQWEWIRMKIGTPTYLDRLRSSMSDLKEIIAILGPIRINSDEGQMGMKAKQVSIISLDLKARTF